MTTAADKPCQCGAERKYGSKCHECHKAYMREYMRNKRATADPRDQKDAYLQKKYNITMDRYEAILATQNGLCGICGTDDPGQTNWFEVDHDHTCCDMKGSCGSCVRGLLCTPCNSGIARFRDDVDNLRKAADYLLSYDK